MERVDRELTWEDAVKLAKREGEIATHSRYFYDAVDKEGDEKFCADYVDKWFTANFKPGYRRGIKWYRFPKLEAGFVRGLRKLTVASTPLPRNRCHGRYEGKGRLREYIGVRAGIRTEAG
jgi:hypothetical protein